MKKKILSMLLTVTLILSLGLMVAPVMAVVPGPTMALIPGGTGTAELSTEQVHSGVQSAKLATVTTDDRGMVRFEFAPGELTLDQLTTLSYWEYVSARQIEPETFVDVFIDIWLDFDGDGDADADDYPGYMQAEPIYTVGAAPLGEWIQIDAMSLMWSTYVGPDRPYEAPTIFDFQANEFTSQNTDMADWNGGVDFGPLSILRIDVRVGYGGTWANFAGYTDDIVINEYTQGFEPPSAEVTIEVVEDIIQISIDPTLFEFGQLRQGQCSVPKPVTITSTSNMDIVVSTSTESAFYTESLSIGTESSWTIVNDWEAGIAEGGTLNTNLKVCVPDPWTAGIETGTIIFWAEEAVTP